MNASKNNKWTESLKKVFQAVVFRLSGIWIWYRLVIGPFDVPEHPPNGVYNYAFHNQGLALLVLVCGTLAVFVFTNPLMIAWYLVYIMIFPVVVAVLLLRHSWFLLSTAYRALKKLTTVYALVLCLISNPIAIGLALSDLGPEVAWWSRVSLAAMTVITLLFVTRLSRNPFLWSQPLIDLFEKFVDRVYGKKAFESLGNKAREDVEKKIKESVDFLGHLQLISTGLNKHRSLFDAWSMKLFLAIFAISSTFVIVNFAAIYASLDSSCPGAWHILSGYDTRAYSSWIFQSICVFTTSGYMHSLPGNEQAMFYCVLETLCAILVVTIFFLQFTHSSRAELENTLKRMDTVIETTSTDIREATQAIESRIALEKDGAGDGTS